MTDTRNALANITECKGACLCGAIQFRVELPITACVHCHCTMCQRAHSAGHVTWIALPEEQLTIDCGGDLLVRYRSSDHGSRSFCGTCGSTLVCQIDERPDEVDIPLASLAPGSGIEPKLHIFFDDRASWTEIGDELPRLGGASGMEAID